jgi:hypothetical protein
VHAWAAMIAFAIADVCGHRPAARRRAPPPCHAVDPAQTKKNISLLPPKKIKDRLVGCIHACMCVYGGVDVWMCRSMGM